MKSQFSRIKAASEVSRHPVLLFSGTNKMSSGEVAKYHKQSHSERQPVSHTRTISVLSWRTVYVMVCEREAVFSQSYIVSVKFSYVL